MHSGLLKCGFTSLGNCGEWRSVYYHYDLKVLMIVYVDDFKLAGPPDAVKKAWKLIETVKITEDDGEQVEAIKIGEVTPVDHFLGCGHHVQKFERDRKKGNAMVWVMYRQVFGGSKKDIT